MQPILRAIPLAALALAACSSGRQAQPTHTAEPQKAPATSTTQGVVGAGAGGGGGGAAVGAPHLPPGPAPTEAECGQLREKAAALLVAIASVPTTDTTDPAHNSLRANAVEGLLPMPGRLEPILRAAFNDRSVGIRSVAAMAMGKAKLRALVDAVQPLAAEEDTLVRASAVFALARCGAPADLNILASMLAGDTQQRALAAFMLGELGNKSAIPMLVAAAKAPSISGSGGVRDKLMRLQIAEALVKLGKADAIEEVRAALFPGQPEEAEAAALAIMIIGQVRDTDSSAQLNNIIADSFPADGKYTPSAAMPIEIRLAAANSLARFGDKRALTLRSRTSATCPRVSAPRPPRSSAKAATSTTCPPSAPCSPTRTSRSESPPPPPSSKSPTRDKSLVRKHERDAPRSTQGRPLHHQRTATGPSRGAATQKSAVGKIVPAIAAHATTSPPPSSKSPARDKSLVRKHEREAPRSTQGRPLHHQRTATGPSRGAATQKSAVGKIAPAIAAHGTTSLHAAPRSGATIARLRQRQRSRPQMVRFEPRSKSAIHHFPQNIPNHV
ncbi:MAG: HEAT repeat domain-containing protein [Phycisphaerales bacterium]